MNIYLAIITTALVITQVIRVTQNAMQLKRQQKHFDEDLAWIRDNDIGKRDFETQRKVFLKLDAALTTWERKNSIHLCDSCKYMTSEFKGSGCVDFADIHNECLQYAEDYEGMYLESPGAVFFRDNPDRTECFIRYCGRYEEGREE